MDFPTQCAVAANKALHDNPAVRQAGDLWCLTAAKARQSVEGWLGEGIPENVILGAISSVCSRFQPSRENPRIGSFKYFDAAVHQAWKDSKAGKPLDVLFADLEVS